jgi:DNA-binding response OmpR family regulator
VVPPERPAVPGGPGVGRGSGGGAAGGRGAGTIAAVKILLVSADPRTREWMALTVRSIARSRGEEPELLEASDGLAGIRLAWRHLPDVVLLDEITSRAGAFAVARELKGAAPPFPGAVVVFLDRSVDAWLARWSGADAWFVKPVNPFEVAERLEGLVARAEKEAV